MRRLLSPLYRSLKHHPWTATLATLAAVAWVAASPSTSLSGSTQQLAGRSADDIWQVTSQRPDGAVARDNIAGQFAIVTFNKAQFDARLAAVGRDTDIAPQGVVMTLPMPDGTFQRFLVKESPMIAPELEAAYPEIKTYSGQGLDDPSATTRFGWTAAGFHSIQLSGETGTTYIDPYTQGNVDTYVVFNKADYRSPGEAWACLVAGEHSEALHRAEADLPLNFGGTLRTYRLALAATAEYTAAAGGTKAGALARMMTTMNRVNGIYERELSVRMTVTTGGTDPTALIFIGDVNADPYTNNNGNAMLTQNQTTLDNLPGLGSANYDIGHVFSTGGGGVAYLGSPCSSTLKAGGVTGSSSPTGDAFDVDYVAHEMGHQFGGNHTFNAGWPTSNLESSCTSGQNGARNAATAYEVGSGVTIQAYAGICASENLQRNSIDRFHVASLNEMATFLVSASGGSRPGCGSTSSTGNTAPSINALSNHSIPLGTPFALNATATDSADAATLSYAWDQYDLGTASTDVITATTDSGNKPLFRSYSASTRAHRTFPSMEYVLSSSAPNVPPTTYSCSIGTCLTGETMPTTARVMNFQLTVRDNRSGGGAFSTAGMTVTTVSGAGPFRVTAPAATVAPGPLNVAWDVANTGAGTTVNTANVKISLSIDGGSTFPIVLLPSTLNNGSASVTIPNVGTSQARIKVEAVGNIFFDVNDSNFTITGADTVPGAPTAVAGTAGNGAVSLSWTAPTTTGGAALVGYQVQVSTSAGGTYSDALGCAGAFTSTQTSCTVSGLTNGTQYFFKVAALNSLGRGAFSSASAGVSPTAGGGGGGGVNTTPDPPTNVTGIAGNSQVNLTWTAPTNTGGAPITGYQVQQATSAGGQYSNANGCPANSTTTSCTANQLVNGTPYFFKVAAINSVGTGAPSAASSAITPVAPCSYTLSSDRASVDRLLSNETVTVTTQTGCAWTATVATGSTSMLSISSGGSGTGSGTVAYQVSANPSSSAARTGTMTIAGQTFTVTQAFDSYTVDVTVQQGSTPVAGAFVALIGTGTARAGSDGAATAGDIAADGTRRKFGAVSSALGIARFRGVVPGTYTMRAHSGGRAVTSGTITVSASVLTATLSMTSSSSALTTLGAYGSQTGTIVADGQTGVFYLNTTAIPSLYRTTDHGGNWSPVTLSSDDPATGLDASSTAGAPTTSGRGGEIATIVGNKVWYSFDFGLTWASMTSPTGVGTPAMYWAHIADTTSTVSQLFLTSSSTANVYVADMTAATPSFAAMAASYKTNATDLVAVGNGDSAPIIAVFSTSTGATKFWVVDGSPANTDASVSVAGLSPTVATNSAATPLTPTDVTLFKIGGPATGVEIVVGTTPVRAPNTVLLYALTSTPASNARMSTCTATACTYPLATVFKTSGDTTSTTSSFANPGIGEVSLCSANFGAVGSVSPLGGAGSVGQCWLSVNGTTSLDVRGVLGVNNNTGMAFDAGYDGTTNLVIISGDGQHGASKSARMTTGSDPSDFGLNRPYFAVYPNIATAGTGSSTGGIAVQGITSAVIRQSIYQPSSATNMASVMSFSGGGRTIGSTDGGTTWFTLVDRGGARMDWWTGATSGSQWMLLGTGGAGNWLYGTQLASASAFAATTQMTSVVNGSAISVGPTDFSMSTSVITSPGVYGVKGITGTDWVGLGSYDGATLRIDLTKLTNTSGTTSIGTLVPLLSIAVPDPFVASDLTAAAPATGSNAGSIRMAYCPTTGSASSVADALFVATAAINQSGDQSSGQVRKVTGLGAAIAANSSAPSFSSAISSALLLSIPPGSNPRDIAVDCANGTVWLARAAQNGGGAPGGSPTAGILKSTDGGTTFTQITLPVGNAGAALQNVVALDFNKTTTTQIVAVSRAGDVLASDDSAATWRLINDTTQAACVGATTQCGRGFGGEEPGGFAMPPVVPATRTSADGAPTAAAATPSSAGLLGSGAGLFQVSLAAAVTPTITGTPATLRFAATKNGAAGALVSVTSAQTVTVTYTGSTAPQWTATSSQPWAKVTNGTGTGAGTFSVSIDNTGNVIAGSTSLSATITLAATNTSTSTTVAVALTVQQQTGGTTAPTGQVDTPTQNSTGAQGAIAMTGWVVDDVGLSHVRIYRQCLLFDNPAACQTVLGTNVVLVGTASVISGARPDVEALYPTLPAANSAGWGFLILSNLLPNIPAQSTAGGGVGTFTLYAVATDVEGNQKLLGRSVNDSTPTTVTVSNDTIAKPFGAIDTPGQGETVSGTLNNFGWALTPDPGTSVLIPTNGSTINVFIDGAVVGQATYNLCRGTVGNPVPSGTLCDDDVSSIFRGAGTAYRNLDAARGPIGLRSINTAALTNGLHTISWGVTDSASRGEGIGSRYFNVLNSTSDQLATRAEADASPLWTKKVSDEPVWGRAGYNLETSYLALEAGATGVSSVVIPELGRLELKIPGVKHAALMANGEVRATPIGLAIDAESGIVTWAVGPGYLGTYRLSFEREDDQVLVDVTVAPALLVDEPVRMHLDRADQTGSAFTLHGWALDPQASTGSGIGAVHIWATPQGGAPVFLGTADLSQSRPDVAAAHGARFPNAGFAFTGALPAEGTWEVTAYIWVARTGRFEDARSLVVTVK